MAVNWNEPESLEWLKQIDPDGGDPKRYADALHERIPGSCPWYPNQFAFICFAVRGGCSRVEAAAQVGLTIEEFEEGLRACPPLAELVREAEELQIARVERAVFSGARFGNAALAKYYLGNKTDRWRDRREMDLRPVLPSEEVKQLPDDELDQRVLEQAIG